MESQQTHQQPLTLLQHVTTSLQNVLHALFLVLIGITITLPKLIYHSLPQVGNPRNQHNIPTKFVLALGLSFALAISTVFYNLLFLPAKTLEWIWTAFSELGAHLEGKNMLIKVPLFLGMGFAMVVGGVGYILFYWPVKGLERVWGWWTGDAVQRLEVQRTGSSGATIKPGRVRIGRRASTDRISDLALGDKTEGDEEREVEDKTMEIVVADVNKWDDGAERDDADAAGVFEVKE